MDPFVEVVCNGQTFKTKVDKGGGTSPTWHDSFDVEIVHQSADKLKISCTSDDFFFKRLVGEAVIPASQFT